MAPATHQILEQAKALSREDRIFLITELEATLEPEGECSEEEVDDAWDEEIARRMERLKRGETTERPIEEVLAKLRQRYP